MDEPQNNQSVMPEVPQTPPSLPVVPVAAAAGGMSGKIIAMIIALLVVAGGVGAYFMFSNKASAPTTYDQGLNTASPSATPQQGTTVSVASLHCVDLFPSSDFQVIIKKDSSEYKFLEDNSYNMLKCEMDTSTSLPWLFFKVIMPPPEENLWKLQKDQAMASANANLKYNAIPGIGSDAYTRGTEELSVLSSNKKYVLAIDATTLDQAEQMAKVIDANLNKY